MGKEEQRSLITRLINRFDYAIFKQPLSSNKRNIGITLFLNRDEIRLIMKILNDYKKALED